MKRIVLAFVLALSGCAVVTTDSAVRPQVAEKIAVRSNYSVDADRSTFTWVQSEGGNRYFQGAFKVALSKPQTFDGLSDRKITSYESVLIIHCETPLVGLVAYRAWENEVLIDSGVTETFVPAPYEAYTPIGDIVMFVCGKLGGKSYSL